METSKRYCREILDYNTEIDKSNWIDVFSACLGKMTAVQAACAELVVRNQNWNVDFSVGTISFGNEEYPLQFLGSESSVSDTWMWGWNNINGFDEKMLQLAAQSKALGEEWDLKPLCAEQFALDDIYNGHVLAIVACGIAEDNYCYYRGPHDSGAILVAFSGVDEDVFKPVDMKTFIDISMQSLQRFNINHKIFVESFLRWNKTAYQWKSNNIIAEFTEELTIKFEIIGDLYRVVGINS